MSNGTGSCLDAAEDREWWCGCEIGIEDRESYRKMKGWYCHWWWEEADSSLCWLGTSATLVMSA